jgi:hypothetical protein
MPVKKGDRYRYISVSPGNCWEYVSVDPMPKSNFPVVGWIPGTEQISDGEQEGVPSTLTFAVWSICEEFRFKPAMFHFDY